MINNHVEFICWIDGSSHGFASIDSLIRWATIEGRNKVEAWHADPETKCVYRARIFHDDVWYWSHIPTGRVIRVAGDPSSDAIALTIVEMFEEDFGHSQHQMVVRFGRAAWPPKEAPASDPTGRWSRVGILPPVFPQSSNNGVVTDDSHFELHYCPEVMADAFRRAGVETVADAESMAGALLLRHTTAIARAELPFDERERAADDFVLELDGNIRDLFIELMSAPS